MFEENLVVKVSAPGKVILHGEHSVVYGKLAIASSLGLRTKVSLEENNSSVLEIKFENLNFYKKYDLKELNNIFSLENIPLVNDETKYSSSRPEIINHDKYLEFITKSLQLNEELYAKNQFLSLASFFYLYVGILMANNVPIEGMCVSVDSDLTLGAGTGSSASFMVSLTGAFLRYLTVKMPNSRMSTEPIKVTNKFIQSELGLISNWAFCAEKIIHGNPSGIDNTICTFGSMVSFRKGTEPTKIHASKDMQGILIDTRIPKNTGEMVKKVADLKNKHPKIIDAVLESMEEITSEALENFICLGMLDKTGTIGDIENCYKNLNELVDINHNLLRTLGVSHQALDDVVSVLATRELHGKLTGAGGGGYVLALTPHGYQFDDLDTLCAQLTAKGYQPLITKLGSTGVSVDE